MALIVFLIAFLTTGIGYALGQLLDREIDINELAGLNQFQIAGLINGLVWFVVCFVVYFGSTKLDEKKFGLISPSFILTWFFVAMGIVLGTILDIIIQGDSVTIDGDLIKNAIFLNLAIALGPTASASMGLNDKD
ncbi:MAG: hypothetical protein GPJ54_08830 [Candidatus Heimdallarchaeota archaeon]|nr:hypothetical protein [Candidatus Heimdallarchaeota archaeon]